MAVGVAVAICAPHSEAEGRFLARAGPSSPRAASPAPLAGPRWPREGTSDGLGSATLGRARRGPGGASWGRRGAAFEGIVGRRIARRAGATDDRRRRRARA